MDCNFVSCIYALKPPKKHSKAKHLPVSLGFSSPGWKPPLSVHDGAVAAVFIWCRRCWCLWSFCVVEVPIFLRL